MEIARGWSIVRSEWGLADILKVLARLEPDRAPRGYTDFLAGARVAADAALAGLHLEDAETAQLDSFSALHGNPHGVEHRVHGQLGLHFRDVGDFRNLVDDVELDHAGSSEIVKYHKRRDLRSQERF